jgi:hypothetical protein
MLMRRLPGKKPDLQFPAEDLQLCGWDSVAGAKPVR